MGKNVWNYLKSKSPVKNILNSKSFDLEYLPYTYTYLHIQPMLTYHEYQF